MGGAKSNEVFLIPYIMAIGNHETTHYYGFPIQEVSWVPFYFSEYPQAYAGTIDEVTGVWSRDLTKWTK